MALMNELKRRLENESELLTKRIRLAKNVVFSDEFNLPSKENFVIKWFCDKIDKSEMEDEIFVVLKDFFSSDHLNHLNSNDTDDSTKKQLLNALKKCLDEPTKCTNIVVNLSTTIGNSNLMQQYMRRNVNEYLDFLRVLLPRITNRKYINYTLENLATCIKHTEDKTKILILFIENLLPVLSVMYGKLEDNRETILDFFYQVLLSNLPRNDYRNIIKNLCIAENDENCDEDITKSNCLTVFLNLFRSSYPHLDTHELRNLLLIYFNSFFKLNKSDFKVAFQFFALWVKFLGFEIDGVSFHKSLKTVKKFNIEKSISLLEILFSNLENVDLSFDNFFNELNFKTYLENVIKTVLRISQKPCIRIYKLLRILIKINPNLVENIIDEILIHTIFKQYDDTKLVSECSLFLMEVFRMFTRLHREQKLISILLKTTAKFLLNDENNLNGFNLEKFNIANSFSDLVVENYCEIIRNLTGKVSLGILRTLIYHFNNDIVENIETKSNDVKFKILYEFEVLLTYEYFMSVAIVDHIVPEIISTKFLNEMNEFKNILGKIGCKLLNMEHQCYLMKSFLQLCRSWGELYTFLYHYKFDEGQKCSIDLSSNYLNDNYLHHYLSPDQWNTIYQRVANFGESRCKQQLELLHSQINCLSEIIEMKLERAGINQNKCFETTSSTSLQLTHSIENKAAQQLIENAIETQNFDILNSIYIQENRSFLEQLITYVFKKIKNELKIHFNKNLQTNKFLKIIKRLVSFEGDEYVNDFSNIIVILDENVEPIEKSTNIKKISKLIDVLRNLPIAYTFEQTRIKIILFAICVHNDFISTNDDIVELSENILEIIIKTNIPTEIFNIIKLKKFLIILKDFKNYEELIKLLCENILRKSDQIVQLKKISKCLIQLNVKKRSKICCIIFKLLKDVVNKKNFLVVEDKNFILKITCQLSEIVVGLFDVKEQMENDVIKLCLLGLAIERCFIEDSKDIMSTLTKHLKDSIEYCFTYLDGVDSHTDQSKEYISIFLNTLLKYFNQIKKQLPDDMISRCCLAIKKGIAINFSNLLAQININEFEIIGNELISDIRKYLQSNSKSKLLVLLRLWEEINSFKFKNPNQINLRQKIVETILIEFLFAVNQNVDELEMLLIILNYIYKLLRSDVFLTPLMIDLTLDILFELKFSNTTTKYHLENQSKLFLSIVSILEISVTSRYIFFFSKIQNLLIMYRILLKQICEKHSLKLEDDCKNIISEWAHNFQKLVKLLIKDKKNVTRLTPYLIADILKYYETTALYPTVKTHLDNSLYELLSVCDSHANSYLLRNLSEGSKTIFKVVHDDYNKFHRFVGRS